MLIDAENGYDLLGSQAFLLGKELLNVRTVSLAPEIFQSLGGTEPVPGVSRARRGLGLEFTHDATSHRGLSRCRWADFPPKFVRLRKRWDRHPASAESNSAGWTD